MGPIETIFPTGDLTVLGVKLDNLEGDLSEYLKSLKAAPYFEHQSEAIANCILAKRHIEDAMFRINVASMNIYAETEEVFDEHRDDVLLNNVDNG